MSIRNILIVSLFCSVNLLAWEIPGNGYYTASDLKNLYQRHLTATELRRVLHELSGRHHQAMDYRCSRALLLASIFLGQDAHGLFVQDLYQGTLLRLNINPGDPSEASWPNLTIEHIWPQSRFSPRFSRRQQKSDLHNLLLVRSKANKIRANYPFGEIHPAPLSLAPVKTPPHAHYQKLPSPVGAVIIPSTLIATTPLGLMNELYYAPAIWARGQLARAMFYFSLRYQLMIDPIEEYYLKKWHRDYPVDAQEQRRNNLIMEAQGNRNPFIDFPDLVEKII